MRPLHWKGDVFGHRFRVAVVQGFSFRRHVGSYPVCKEYWPTHNQINETVYISSVRIFRLQQINLFTGLSQRIVHCAGPCGRCAA